MGRWDPTIFRSNGESMCFHRFRCSSTGAGRQVQGWGSLVLKIPWKSPGEDGEVDLSRVNIWSLWMLLVDSDMEGSHSMSQRSFEYIRIPLMILMWHTCCNIQHPCCLNYINDTA
jgi:hypothetical protein